MTAGVHTKPMPSNGVKGLFACGSASPAPIVGNFGGRFFHLKGVASVVGTTRRAGGHKPMLLAPMKGYFGLLSGSYPGEATVYLIYLIISFGILHLQLFYSLFLPLPLSLKLHEIILNL